MFLIENINRDNYTEIIEFYRDENGKKCINRVKDFKPYFYVPAESETPDDYRITHSEPGHVSITGEQLRKLFIRKANDVPKMRSKFAKHYEADVPFNQRYIIDRLGEVKPYKLKTLAIDIELDSHNEFPDLQNPDQKVVSIAMKDNFEKKEILLILDNGKNNIKESEIVKKYDLEEDLLQAFIGYLNIYDPDIITGWNVVNFDLTYLIRRMAQFDIYPGEMSPLGWVNISEKYEDVTIKGRIVLDGMAAYKHFRKMSNQGQAESYSLEFTAQDQLGMGKIPHTETYREMWQNNPDKLIEYNLRDNDLVLRLDEKLKIIEFFNNIRCKSCSQLADIYRTTTLVDGALLKEVHNKIVLPSKNSEGGDGYQGAKVEEPTPGLYENVLALDVKGMYPNIIKTFNMGYETFNPNGEIQISEGIGFDRGIGIISQVIRKLEKERNYNKKLMKEAYSKGDKNMGNVYNFRQYAVKVLMNSFYGYLGFAHSRLYIREVADAITRMGRRIIKWTQSVLKNEGYVVVYGDTDSVYVKSKEKGLFGMLREGQNLVKLINESYIELAKRHGADDCTLEMEFEKIFKRILFVGKRDKKGGGAKKKYGYLPLWKEGKDVKNEIEITGFETVRSDTPRIAREIQFTVLNKMLKGSHKEEIIEYLKDMYDKIISRTIPDEEFGNPKGIKDKLENYGKERTREDGTKYKPGVPPVITGAKYSNMYLGTQFGQGSKPKWIYVKNVPFGYPETHVVSFEEHIPEGFIPDWDRITDGIFNKKLEAIFQAAKWGTLPELNKQVKTLDQWGM